MSSYSGSLPARWSIAALADVCKKIQDGTHFSPKTQLADGSYRYITAKNVRSTGLDLGDVTYLRPEDHRAIFRRCDPRKGDVLLVKDGVNTGDVAINTLDEEISLLSSVCFLRPEAGVLSSSFLRYFLMSPAGQQSLTGRMTGTAIRRIVLHRIKETRVPVAPPGEQERIVETLDGYLSQLDAAVAGLESAQKKLKAYRASVLKAAVEGRLVPTEAELARAEGRSYEPADVLLERILKERRRHWEDAELAKMKAAGKTQQDDRWRARYQEPEPADTAHLPTLPTGWCWASLDELLVEPLANGKSVPHGQGFSVLRLTSIKAGRVDLEQRKTGNWGILDPRAYVLRRGDFLIVRGNGSIHLVGRAGLVTEDADDVAYPDTLIRARVNPDAVLPELLVYNWDSPPVRAHIQSRAKTTAGIHKVNQADLSQTPVPLAPLAEQHRIVEEIDRLLSVSAAIGDQVTSASARTRRLRQSVLASAFEGKLVDHDPADEPADMLLARLRQAPAGRPANAEAPADLSPGPR